MSDLRQVLQRTLRGGTENRVNREGRTKNAKAGPTAKSVRKMIVLQNAQCYKHCLMQLQALGVKPLKKVAAHHAVVCRFPAKASMKALQAHAMVKRVETDRKMRIHALPQPTKPLRIAAACASIRRKQIIPWGIDRIGAPKVWNRCQGGGIRVAVLDTGVSGTHPDLKLVRSHNTIAGQPGYDQNGHGTHVSGTIAARNNRFGVVGAAPKIRLYSVKAFDSSGSAYVSDIVQGLDWCIRNNMQVINMSFGMEDESATVKELLRKAYKKGIILVASAGNSGTQSGKIDFPGRLPEVIAVAAATKDGKIAEFSSRGQRIAVAAPGVGICSTVPKKSYTRMDGTSMAAPHVSGTAALLLSANRKLTPDRIKKLLQDTAIPLSGYSSTAQGAGLIRAGQALNRV